MTKNSLFPTSHLTLLGMTYFYNVKVRGGVSQTPPRKWPLRLPEVVFETGNQMLGIYEDILGPEIDRKWAGNGPEMASLTSMTLTYLKQ